METGCTVSSVLVECLAKRVGLLACSFEGEVAIVAFGAAGAIESPTVGIFGIAEHTTSLVDDVSWIALGTVSILLIVILAERTDGRTLADGVDEVTLGTLDADIVGVELLAVGILEEDFAGVGVGVEGVARIAACAGSITHVGGLAEGVDSLAHSVDGVEEEA